MGAPQTHEMTADLKKQADEGTPPPSTLQTYLNLVQQYLGVFMIENAQWLAERCVADYPSSSEAVYLLALCHFRSRSPQAARQVLELSKAPMSPSMEYLIAVCSFDLEEFDRAENVLLRSCRNLYRQSRTDTSVASLDDWILSTSVSVCVRVCGCICVCRLLWMDGFVFFLHYDAISHLYNNMAALSCPERSSGFSTDGECLSSNTS